MKQLPGGKAVITYRMFYISYIYIYMYTFQYSSSEDGSPLPEYFWQRCKDMVCNNYGQFMGPDYAGNG